eukprot:jgi/Orpsp1_1/1183855/evm.model.c7180000086944.1
MKNNVLKYDIPEDVSYENHIKTIEEMQKADIDNKVEDILKKNFEETDNLSFSTNKLFKKDEDYFKEKFEQEYLSKKFDNTNSNINIKNNENFNNMSDDNNSNNKNDDYIENDSNDDEIGNDNSNNYEKNNEIDSYLINNNNVSNSDIDNIINKFN